MRAVLELAGIRDILSKSLGTSNPTNLLAATVDGLKNLRTPAEVADLRGKQVGAMLDSGAPRPEAEATDSAADASEAGPAEEAAS